MMTTTSIRHARKPSEEGYMLVVVVFLLAILMLSLTVAAPVIKKEIQRDREVETMHRGKQYARAVKLYYKKFGAYPPTVDALVKQNEIRFLRRKYIDPTTGKEDWKIIRVGQQKTQTLGFFGQPIGGAGALTGTPVAGSSLGGSSTTGGSSLFGSNNAGTGTTDPNATTGAVPTGTTGSATDPSGGTAVGTAGGTAGGAGSSGSSSSATGTGLSGQTFGGGPIIGFSPNSPKQSILVYKKKNHYNEWEFIYDPLADQMMQGGNTGAIGQPVSNTTTPVGTGTPTGFSLNLNSNGTNGGSNSGGSSGNPPTAPTTPTPPPQ
jgi:hypothetical protein